MAIMDPKAQLPRAHHQRVEAKVIAFTEPRLGAEVTVAAPGAAVAESFLAADGVKTLLRDKEPLPFADEVDDSQILRARARPEAPPSVPAKPPKEYAEAEAPAVSFDSGVIGNPQTIPPDTHGAVSRSHAFAPHNNRIWIHDRAGNHILDMTLDQFWNVFGTPIDTFDPKVLYDPLTNRFIFVTCANAVRADSAVLVAVSLGDDPSGDWVFGKIDVDSATMGEVWLDYPSVGYTDDKITIGLNLFTLADNAFAGAVVFVVDKPSLLHPPHDFQFDQFVLTDQGATHAPAVTLDPGVADQYLVSAWTGDFLGSGYLALYRLTGSVSQETTDLQRVGFLQSSAPWDAFPPTGNFAPQQGSQHKINTGDNRMQSVVYRHGQLYAVHTVFLPRGGPDRSAVQWHEIELGADPGIVDGGFIEDPGGNWFYAFPSVAVNAQQDVLIGMASFSDTVFASGAHALRPSGQAFGVPVLFAPGTESYHLTFGGPRNRWGDYSAAQVDPENDRDFWTIQEYAGTPANTWRTRWVQVTVPVVPIA